MKVFFPLYTRAHSWGRCLLGAAFMLIMAEASPVWAQGTDFILEHDTRQEFLLWPMVGATVNFPNQTTSLTGIFHTQWADALDLRIWLIGLQGQQVVVKNRFSISPGIIYGQLPSVGAIVLPQTKFTYSLQDPALKPKFEVMVGYLWFTNAVQRLIKIPDNLKVSTAFSIAPSLSKRWSLVFSETLFWRGNQTWYGENRVLGGLVYRRKVGSFNLAYQGRWRKGVSFVEGDMNPDRWTHTLIARWMFTLNL